MSKAIVPVVFGSLSHNVVSMYMNSEKGPVFHAQLMNVEPGEFAFEKCIIFTSPGMRHRIGEIWKRNNAKQLESVGNDVKQQIESKSGPVWDELSKFLEKNGTRLVD